MGKSTPSRIIASPQNRGLYRADFLKPRALWADIALNTDAMKHPVLTLLVLAAVLMPWMATVALADWLRSLIQGRRDPLEQ